MGSGVWSAIQVSSGVTTRLPVTLYTDRVPATVKITSSPSTRSSRWRKGLELVMRWPAKTVFPGWPGSAVPVQWLGPRSMLWRVTPS